jgi:hypothetical protein
MDDLEELAMEHLRSQLHSWSSIEFFDRILEMYATDKEEARRFVVTEAAKSYSRVPHLAQALQKAAREGGEFAVDLMRALSNTSATRRLNCSIARWHVR